MTAKRRKVATAMGTLAGCALLWGIVQFGWYKPRSDALLAELADATGTVADFEADLDRNPRLQAQLQEIVDRTLGGDVETVDHRLRTRLNRIAEDIQLHQPAVSTSRPSAKRSPARLALPRNERDMRDELDFIELDGTISAEGSLEQIVTLIDRIDAEPWIKRMHGLRVEPKSNGERFSVSLRLTTLLLPGRSPTHVPADEYDAQRLARFATLIETNPFRMPPPAVAEPAESATASRPAGPRVERWLVTGVAQGPQGAEAWLRNGQSGESRRVTVGERIHDAVLVAAGQDEAEFEQGERRLVVAVGGTLSIRR